MGLEHILASAEAAAKAKAAKLPQPAPMPPPILALARLPAWPESVRALPNGFLRSALFGVIRKGPRRYMEHEPIAAVFGIEILFTGKRLDQGDSGVYQGVLHIARNHDLGSQCRFSAYSLLKLLGKKDTGGNRDTLYERLFRLKAATVEVKQGRFTYIGSLIDEVFKDEITHEYVIVLNEKMRALFGDSDFTLLDWKIYSALDGKPLAQWLHGFYSSHAKPYPIGISKLYELCGSESSVITDFKKDLLKAFDSVSYAAKTQGQHFEHEILDGLVYVRRVASASQRRHLCRRAAAKPSKNTK
jgi:hypothetical protein